MKVLHHQIEARHRELIAEARALRQVAADQRCAAKVRRRSQMDGRLDRMQTIRTARSLRFDTHGRIAAVWRGDDKSSTQILDETVNGLFRVSLSLSALASSLNGSRRARALSAIDEVDDLIREIRRAALREEMGPDAATGSAWVDRVKETASEIDDLLTGSARHSTTEVFDLREASQAAHRALLALRSQYGS